MDEEQMPGEMDKVVAFIMLITDSNSTQSILGEIRKMKGVTEAYMIYGDWDIICKVVLDKLPDLTTFMMDVRKKFAIKKSATLITLAE